MKTKILLGILIAAFIVSFVYFIKMNQGLEISGSSVENLAADSLENVTSIQNSAPDKISLSDLSLHNSKENCWVAYDGKVYDITSFLPKHPGSAGKIIPYCGTSSEFTQAFTKQHGTFKAGMLMKVGTFIGDFDVVGKVETNLQSEKINLASLEDDDSIDESDDSIDDESDEYGESEDDE